jgi:hypothetical protein
MQCFNMPRHMKGQSLVESIIVLPLFGLLMFGVLEISYMLHTKSTLNAATFDAARKGALYNAKASAMKDAMAGTMAALFLRSNPTVANANIAKLKTLTLLNIPASPIGKIEIISPSKAVFDKFKKKIYVTESLPSETLKETKKEAIPNDNLMWRSAAYQNIKSGSDTLNINIQDANLLKIRTLWCHKLLVPFLDKFIHWTFTIKNPEYGPQIPTTEQLQCDLYAAVVKKTTGVDGYYVPVTSSAIVRMQSPVVGDDLK